MVLVVCIKNRAFRLPIHMMIFQDWYQISATCLMSWWCGVRGCPKFRKGSLKLSLNVINERSTELWQYIRSGTNWNICLFTKNNVWVPPALHCPWCGVLVLIPDFTIFNDFLKSHSVCRVKFGFGVVWFGFCFIRSDRQP